MLKEVVVAEVSFDQGSRGDAHVDSARNQLPSQLTFVDISSAVGQHPIQSIANTSTRSHATAQVCMHRGHRTFLVAQFDFTKVLLGWTFRYEIENARGIGWA